MFFNWKEYKSYPLQLELIFVLVLVAEFMVITIQGQDSPNANDDISDLLNNGQISISDIGRKMPIK